MIVRKGTAATEDAFLYMLAGEVTVTESGRV